MEKAFEILAAQYRPMLLSYASALLYGDIHKAEDVVQEALFTAHQRLDTFRQGENFALAARDRPQQGIGKPARISQRAGGGG